MSILIYTKEDCVYCSMAKELLNSRNIPYTEKVLGLDFTREDLLARHSLAKTFPVVVVDEFYIGGYNNLAARIEHFEKEALEQAAAAATAVEVAEAPADEAAAEQPKTTTNRKR